MIHSEFDGNTGSHSSRGRTADQSQVFGKLAREDPDLFEWITSLPKAVGNDKQRIADLRDMLEKLRGM